MDFSLTDEERAIRDTARQFITKEVMPLERAREAISFLASGAPRFRIVLDATDAR